MKQSSRCSTFVRITSLGCLVILAGCGQPIYEGVTFEPTAAEITLTTDAESSSYQWPLTRDGYVVAKPPPMAYVTSFSEPLTRPDPVTARLVPWSEEGLDDRAKRLLREAYSPISDQPNVTLTLGKDQYAGEQAFDVSVDGSRLIVLDHKRLSLYRTDDGSLVGHLELPAEVANASPAVSAVRFCGASKDLLVASERQIFRISGRDKSVLNRSAGCGGPIVQWIVNDDDTAMLMLSESGKLFGGDPHLNVFTAYDVGAELTFDACGLSQDGTRIGVVVGNRPRTYLVDSFQIVDQRDWGITLDPKRSISMGHSTDAWVDGDGLFYVNVRDGKETDAGYHMFWKPLAASCCFENEETNWFLIVGHRFVDGGEQTVLFDYGPVSRNHSIPTILDQLPQRIAHGSLGTRVAICDGRGLHLIRRELYRSRNPVYLSAWTYSWISEDKIDVIERVLAIICSQVRLGYGHSSEELRSYMIQEIANRWRDLEQNELNSKALASLEEWLSEGSQLARVSSGLRHYKIAWDARGNGFINTVSEKNLQIYRDRMRLAQLDFDKAIAMGDPPLEALNMRIHVGLESGEGLEGVDSLCRLACELYPCEIDPHEDLIIKLLPQWFGEGGEMVSFARSVSTMLAEPEASLLYLRLISTLPYYIAYSDREEWKAYDTLRARRGLDEWLRREIFCRDDLFMFWSQMDSRTHDRVMADRVLTYLMKHYASPPYQLTHGDFAYESVELHNAAERIRGR